MDVIAVLQKKRMVNRSFLLSYIGLAIVTFVLLYYFIGMFASIALFAANFIVGLAAFSSFRKGNFTLIDIVDGLQNLCSLVKETFLKKKNSVMFVLKLAFVVLLLKLLEQFIYQSAWNHLFNQPTPLNVSLFQILDMAIATATLTTVMVSLIVLLLFSYSFTKSYNEITTDEMLALLQQVQELGVTLPQSHNDRGHLSFNIPIILDQLFKNSGSAEYKDYYEKIQRNFTRFQSLKLQSSSTKWSFRLIQELSPMPVSTK